MNPDIKVTVEGEPIAMTEKGGGFDPASIYQNIVQLLAEAFPRKARTTKGGASLDALAQRICEAAYVKAAARIAAHRDQLLSEAARAARYRCRKCGFQMAPGENICRSCAVRSLTEQNRLLRLLVETALKPLKNAGDVTGELLRDETEKPTRARADKINRSLWRVCALLETALEDVPATLPIPDTDAWLRLDPVATTWLENLLKANGWTISPTAVAPPSKK